MRPSRPCVSVLCPRPAWLLGLVLLSGLAACGSPSPDAPLSGQATGSAGTVLSPPAGAAASANAHDDRTAPLRLGPASSPAQPGPLSIEAARVPHAAPTARPQPVLSPADSPEEQATADQAQRQAWDRWYAEAREHPDVGVRLMALEHWAQQPSAAIDPVTAALVDEDEEVRTRAEALYDQQLTRETTRAQPVQEKGQEGGTTQ
jgi:hypothetical protein